ncbi:MAG TPA: hypothetical protein VHP33_14605 [Polyangiaceae bacterium]|nr:hypothetical protein [Polyangiaceae bacterium]
MRQLFNVCLLGLCFAVGCSSDADPEQTREGFCRDWAAKACSAKVESACQAESADACRLTQQAACQGALPEGFVDDNASACLTAVGKAYEDADLDASELATVLRFGPPCDRLVRGERAGGDSCESTTECDAAAGFACVIKGSDSQGTCQKPRVVQPGLACDALQETCTEGFYCNGENCVVGEDVGAPCATQQECGSQAYCAADGTCAERFPVRAECTADYECLSGVCVSFDAERICVDAIRLSLSEPLCEDLR